jgi:hypothetical protein
MSIESVYKWRNTKISNKTEQKKEETPDIP